MALNTSRLAWVWLRFLERTLRRRDIPLKFVLNKKKVKRIPVRRTPMKTREKTEIRKLKIFFSECGMNMTVKRCFPSTMIRRKKPEKTLPSVRTCFPRSSTT